MKAISRLSWPLAASLLAFPFAAYAVDYGSQPPQTQQSPPVAQPLVREGDFAMKLAAKLDLGNPSDEASAEQMLAEAGVKPADGWISDYPMTPAVIAQLNDSLMFSAAKGKLRVSYEDAQQSVADLVQQMNLPLPTQGGTGATTPAPTNAVSDYYASEGPPVITYYAPPAAYAYMYDWVPFPAFWFGVTFPGFFIRHHFSTTVVVSPFFGHHPHHRAIVTNRFVDHATHKEFFVDHHGFPAGPAMRSQRMMHADAGRTFGSTGRSRGLGTRSFGGPMHPPGGRAAGPMHSPGGRAAGGFGHGMGRGR